MAQYPNRDDTVSHGKSAVYPRLIGMHSMPLGLDYAGGVPTAEAIKEAGYTFVVRYLTAGGPGLPGKLLTPGEFTALQSAGISVVLNWETTADRMRDGYPAGTFDAQAAAKCAAKLGVPNHRPIYFSADWDATEIEQQQIDNYLRGVASVIGATQVGVYGSYYVVKRCLDHHTAMWAWQTGAWSGGLTDPRAHLYQHIGNVTVDGVECDVNEALVADFGQHPRVTSGVPDMPMGVIPSGAQVTKLTMPIGPSVSQLVARGWLSLASSENGTGRVWVAGPKIDGRDYTIVFVKDRRWFIELPDGADQVTIHTDGPGSVGWCVELQPR